MSVLYNSGVEKTKHFFKGGTFFGWKTIERLWEREMERSQKGQMVTIPRMKSRYVYRDSWTRLNVTPAKIMQVCDTIHMWNIRIQMQNCIIINFIMYMYMYVHEFQCVCLLFTCMYNVHI